MSTHSLLSATQKRTRLRRGSAAGVMALLALACGASGASAAPAWLAPVDLSAAGQNADGAGVAVDRQGNAIAVWTRSNGADSIVQAAVRAPGGGFGPAQDLSVAGNSASVPQIALDAHGNAIAVWQRSNGANSIVQAAFRPAGGSFGAAQNLSAAGQHASDPQVAFDGEGAAVAVWQRSNGTHSIVQSSFRPAGGSFGAVQDLSAAGQNAYEPQVAVDSHGNAVAVWERYNGAHYIVQASFRPAGGSFGAVQDLSAVGQSAQHPQVALDGQANAVAVWERYNGFNHIVQAATRPGTSGVWQSPKDLSAAGQDAFDPQVSFDRQGNALAVWRRNDGVSYIVQAAMRSAGGSFGAAQDVSAAGHTTERPQVAFDEHGDAIAVWSGANGANYIVQAARRPAGGTFGAAQDLSVGGQNALSAQVGLDDEGNATVVWRRSNGANDIVQGAGYDAAGPRLQGLSVPATGTVGAPVSVSVSPLDAWSAPGATSWSFGDGATAAGTTPTHAFATPGTFTVGVSSSDVLGNATTASRTITIAPAAPSAAQRASLAAVSRLRLSRSAFRVGRAGTRVSYTLNVAAKVRFTIKRAAIGRRVGRSCVKPTKGNTARKACTRYRAVPGSITRTRKAGGDRFTFTGKLAGHSLARGHYELIATPTANRKTGKSAKAGFQITR